MKIGSIWPEGITTLSRVQSQLDGKVGQLSGSPLLPASVILTPPPHAYTAGAITLLMRWSAGPAGRWGYGHMILERGKEKYQRKMLNLSYKILPRATTCKNSVPNMESSNETQMQNECSTVAQFIVYRNLNRICIRLLCENCINLNYAMLFRSIVFFFSVHSFY